MSFSISSDVDAIAAAINGFNAQYHADYANVRREAVGYLSEPPSPESAQRLARKVLVALNSWQAGTRAAPSCQPADAAAKALCNPALHQKLKDLASSFPYLAILNGIRSLKPNSPFSTVAEFDACLLSILHDLANAFLVANTNVTYPMKALLLITGLLPAFDSQVRDGLAKAGLSGFKDKTQYLLSNRDCADMRKICVMPFYIADCASHSSALLNKAIENSSYPLLKDQYGRVFDVLLFMQNTRTPEAALIRFSSAQPSRQWHKI